GMHAVAGDEDVDAVHRLDKIAVDREEGRGRAERDVERDRREDDEEGAPEDTKGHVQRAAKSGQNRQMRSGESVRHAASVELKAWMLATSASMTKLERAPRPTPPPARSPASSPLRRRT